jgi:hypothetical protein
MREVAEKFTKLFQGSTKAHGYFEINKNRGDGKKQGNARTIKTAGPSITLWESHLAGEYGLGVIPIDEQNSCCWGCIDVDVYPLDHTALVTKIESLKLPLVTCRSKSGGAHIFLFTTEPVEAGEMQDTLREVAAGLGYSGLEIFPKQREVLVDRGDIGSWLNMPYFSQTTTTRYGLSVSGEALSPLDFLEFANTRKITPKELYSLTVESADDLEGGPPCLQILLKQGFPEGTRNNGLFNIGVYLKKSHPDDWENLLEEYNRKYVQPPLPAQEVLGLIQTHKKKDYNYKCSDEPIRSYCNSTKCRTCKYGVGEAYDAPTFSSLAKLDTDPPLWFLSVNDRRVELTTEQLQNQLRFQRACMDSLNIMPPRVKDARWQELIQHLLDNGLEIIEISQDVSVMGQFEELVEAFCTDLAQASTRDELLLGKPWTDDGKTYFRIRDLTDYLVKNRFLDLKPNQIASRLRDMNAEHVFFNIRGRGVNTWCIPAFTYEEEIELELPEMKEDPF